MHPVVRVPLQLPGQPFRIGGIFLVAGSSQYFQTVHHLRPADGWNGCGHLHRFLVSGSPTHGHFARHPTPLGATTGSTDDSVAFPPWIRGFDRNQSIPAWQTRMHRIHSGLEGKFLKGCQDDDLIKLLTRCLESVHHYDHGRSTDYHSITGWRQVRGETTGSAATEERGICVSRLPQRHRQVHQL